MGQRHADGNAKSPVSYERKMIAMENTNEFESIWEPIITAFEKAHPRLISPTCYHPFIPWKLGGDSPLDTIVVYDADTYYYFLTCGFSEPFDNPAAPDETGTRYSGYGFELTVRLKKSPLKDEELEKRSMAGVLQALGTLSYEEGEIFQPMEYIYTGQQTGMDAGGVSKITGFITIPDSAGVADTPDGKVRFVQLIGMTDKELLSIVNKENTVLQLVQKLGGTLTDYGRDDLL